jgi:hypothetical protein
MQIDRKVVEQVLEALEYHVEQTRPIWKTSQAIDTLRDALARPARIPQTFEEFIAIDEGVRRFGLELRNEWIDAAREGWEAAMRAKKENV